MENDSSMYCEKLQQCRERQVFWVRALDGVLLILDQATGEIEYGIENNDYIHTHTYTYTDTFKKKKIICSSAPLPVEI